MGFKYLLVVEASRGVGVFAYRPIPRGANIHKTGYVRVARHWVLTCHGRSVTASSITKRTYSSVMSVRSKMMSYMHRSIWEEGVSDVEPRTLSQME